MMKKEKTKKNVNDLSPLFLTYSDVLEQLKEEEKGGSHLLLGNGFNRGLGVDTSYQAIFAQMTKNDLLYKDAKSIFEDNKNDLEIVIKKLIDDIANTNSFLKKYVKNKVKHDFMKATHEIVKSKIKNVYNEKNEGVFILLQNFTNYFTLNYDAFLYLILLNFKLENSEEKERTIVLYPTLKFMQEDINEVHDNIYSEIEEARNKGTLNISVGEDNESILKDMKDLTKKRFGEIIQIYFEKKNKGYLKKDITRVVNHLWEEEKRTKILAKVDDGFLQILLKDNKEFIFDIEKETQNLFFLHGAFHIYRDGKEEKKITQSADKALYDKLEEILNNEKRDIICIFQAENKKDKIDKSNYLTNSLNKLNTLSGVLVIIGCSLSDNDSHIFKQIDNSKIDTIYIASFEKNKIENYDKAKKHFKNKNIILFDTDSISYQLPLAT